MAQTSGDSASSSPTSAKQAYSNLELCCRSVWSTYENKFAFTAPSVSSSACCLQQNIKVKKSLYTCSVTGGTAGSRRGAIEGDKLVGIECSGVSVSRWVIKRQYQSFQKQILLKSSLWSEINQKLPLCTQWSKISCRVGKMHHGREIAYPLSLVSQNSSLLPEGLISWNVLITWFLISTVTPWKI